MNRDPLKSAMSCGCDMGAKHLCAACREVGLGYGCIQLCGVLTPGDVTTLKRQMPKQLFPDSAQGRKDHPIFTGFLMYFPDAIAAIARVSKKGNDQHNPGEPLHWARGKSTDQMDTSTRHMMDHGTGTTKDTDGEYHLAKAAWRLCAELQLTIEREREGR